MAVLISAALILLELARRPQRAPVRTVGIAFAALLVMITGCSGSGGGGSAGTSDPNVAPPSHYEFTIDAPATAAAGTGTVTVTAAMGGVTRTAQLSVTVN